MDAATGKSLMTFSGMDEDVLAVAISPDGNKVVSAGHEPAIRWWNPQTAERLRVQGGHGVAVHELGFSNDGKLLASASADGTVRLWNGETGAAVKTLPLGTVTYAVAISPDGRRVATGSFDGFVRLWEVPSGRHLVTLLSLPSVDDQLAWLAMTPQGYTEVAEALKQRTQWRVGEQGVSADMVWNTLRQTELVLKAFRGEAVPPPIFK
jgi:WD40 repeat protein